MLADTSLSGLRGCAAYRSLSYEWAGVAPHKQILDVGCGAGDDVIAMAREVGAMGEVVGVDPDPELIGIARRRLEATGLSARFEVATAHKLPFDENYFDGVRAVNHLSRLANPDAAVAEMFRVARPGASVTASDPDYGSVMLDVENMSVAQKAQSFLLEWMPNSWSGRRLLGMFHRASFEDIVVRVLYRPLTWIELKDEIRLEEALTTMVRRDLLAVDEAKAFIRELQDRAASGTLFGGLAHVMVAGHKPTA